MEKSLTKINENNIFYKIKSFFVNLFKKKENTIVTENNVTSIKEKTETKSLIEEISGKNSEELALVELQKKYKNGEILEDEMTKEQVDALCDLYDIQNEKLRSEIEYKEKKILEYRNSKKVS